MTKKETAPPVAAHQSGYMPKRYLLIGLCFCATLICYIDRVIISVAAIAMQDTYGWSETTKGFVLSSFFIGYMLFQIPGGYLANRFGGKVVLGVAVAWWSLFTVLTPIAAAASLPLLIITRIAMGLGEAATIPSIYNLFGRWVPATESSRSVSLVLSAIPLGTLFALITTGWLITQYGWPSVFYIFGVVGSFWVAIWFAKAYNRPEEHPHISEHEISLLRKEDDQNIQEETAIPWGKLFRIPAVWALLINHFCSNWGLYLLLAWLPSYLKKMQGLSIEYAGLVSAIPWLIMFIMINLGGWIADNMIKHGITLTTVRKTMQTIGLGGSAVFFLLASGSSSGVSPVLLMCGALGFTGFTLSGYASNHIDIAPRYADVLVGITNTAGTVPGIIGVIIAGWLVDLTGSFSSVFLLAASINVIGIFVWLKYGTAERVI
jgi:ACS family sodium-dependent inorganic phosphate cotransporter